MFAKRSMFNFLLILTLLAGLLSCQPPPATTAPTEKVIPETDAPPTPAPPPTETQEPTPIPEPPAHCGSEIVAPSEPIHAVHMTGNWGTNRVNEAENTLPAEYYEYLRDLNVNWVGISVGLHYDDSMDSTVERVYSDVMIPTFTDNFLRKMIRTFHQHDICVYLTLAFEAHEAEVAEHPVARWQLGGPTPIWNDGRIQSEFWPWAIDHPDHERFVAEFWQTYTEQAVHFGQLADEEGVALYSLGTETEGLFRTRLIDEWPNDFSEELQAMVSAVREVYSGPLTYDMMFHIFTEPPGFLSGARSYDLWEDLGLDVIGISAYFELTNSLPTRVLSVEELETSWEAIFQNYLIPLQDANPDLPIYFTEFGYVDSIRSPYDQEGEMLCRYFDDADDNGLDDGEETQANIYQALFNVMDSLPGVVNGVFIWEMWIATDEQWASEAFHYRDYSLREKLAEDVLRATYEGALRVTQDDLYIDIPTPFEVEESLVIYADALGSGWEIWPWEAEVDPDVESVVHSGQMALGITFGPWGGIPFFKPLNFSEYAYLEFYINGGQQGGQELIIRFWDVENDIGLGAWGLCSITSSATLPPDEWVLIRLPLKHLDLSGRQASINITNNLEQPAPQFYLDDIRLVKEAD